MKIESTGLKMLKKVDDTTVSKASKSTKTGKPVTKAKAKRESKKTLKMLPGQVPAILFSKS